MQNKNGEIGIVLPAELAKSAEDMTDKYSCPQLKDIYNIDILYQGYLNARRGKRNRKAIYEFELNLWAELQDLSETIKNKTYKPSKYRTFKVYEPKERIITAPTFKDSVVQHTIYMLINNIFDKGFICQSYGCRKDKGTHKASKKLQEYMRDCSRDEYYLQMDIHKYYYSIKHSILKDSIQRKIKDNNLVDLIMKFVNIEDEIGLYIGNLLSQLFGLIYMDRLDHYIKRHLKQHNYLRYVDDFVIIGLEYEEAKNLLENIKKYLKDELCLSLSKFRIAKVKKGCNFVGYRTWQSKKYVRKRTLYHFSKALKTDNKLAVNSLLGHAAHSSTIGYFLFKLQEKQKCTTNIRK